MAADSDRDLRTRLQLDLLDVKYQYVTGYPGTADARLALQRGDIQVFMESLASYRQAIEPGIVANGVAIPLWFDPIDDGATRSSNASADQGQRCPPDSCHNGTPRRIPSSSTGVVITPTAGGDVASGQTLVDGSAIAGHP